MDAVVGWPLFVVRCKFLGLLSITRRGGTGVGDGKDGDIGAGRGRPAARMGGETGNLRYESECDGGRTKSGGAEGVDVEMEVRLLLLV